MADLRHAVAPNDPTAFCVAVDAMLPRYAVGADYDETLEELLDTLVLNAPSASLRRPETDHVKRV